MVADEGLCPPSSLMLANVPGANKYWMHPRNRINTLNTRVILRGLPASFLIRLVCSTMCSRLEWVGSNTKTKKQF